MGANLEFGGNRNKIKFRDVFMIQNVNYYVLDVFQCCDIALTNENLTKQLKQINIRHIKRQITSKVHGLDFNMCKFDVK